jgi:hypothetical protein
MNERWYKLSPSWARERIESVSVEKYTDATVTIKGRRRSRITSYESYFPTADDAKAEAVRQAERAIESAKLSLARAQSALDVARKIDCASIKEASK